jgi:transcriptional regulator with XRE-family HTH domain
MTKDEIRRQELSNFLRTRRERLHPSDVGLLANRRRRTPGLRREEVAQLAGMSATWYTWLEQKRPIKVSFNVLDNLARVLRLDPIERVQLFQLALHNPVVDPAPRREEVSPLIQRTLDRMDAVAAFIMGPRWDVLAWNHAARAFFFDFETVPREERNLVWLAFTSPALRSLLADWPTRAQDILARFRGDYGRHAGDPHFVQLVERLNSVSAEFAQWWPRHDVRPQSEGRKQYNHPVAGPLLAEHLTFSMTDNPELRLTIFAPIAAGDSIAKFDRIVGSFKVGRSDSRKERAASAPGHKPSVGAH